VAGDPHRREPFEDSTDAPLDVDGAIAYELMAPLVEVLLGKRERLLDAEPGAHSTTIIPRIRHP
jgi:hypothetical protein